MLLNDTLAACLSLCRDAFVMLPVFLFAFFSSFSFCTHMRRSLPGMLMNAIYSDDLLIVVDATEAVSEPFTDPEPRGGSVEREDIVAR
eukprot:3133398-Prymnesium_polylepis.1